MKKTILLIFVPLMLFLTLSAQVTQTGADSIVKEHMNGELKSYTIYAKENVQTGFEITTATGEILELDYPCWVHYVDFANVTNGKYLIVKESNGNLLEINVINDEEPANLRQWRIVVSYPAIPFEDCLLEHPPCYWIIPHTGPWQGFFIINSLEETEGHIFCHEGTSEIDFSQYTLLLARIATAASPTIIEKHFQQISDIDYNLYLYIMQGESTYPERCLVAILVQKLPQNATVSLIRNSNI